MKPCGLVPWALPLLVVLFVVLNVVDSDPHTDIETATGDDPDLDKLEEDTPDFSADDRSGMDRNWKLWVSPSRLTGFKLSSTTTSLERYQQKLADRDFAKATAGMDDETIFHLQPLDCRYSGPYRSFDGSCNNLYHGCWGRSDETYGRMLSPEFGDGLDTPRKGRHGNRLPNVRLLSTLMQGNQIQSEKTASKYFTDLNTHFGQFVAHEVSSAAPYSDKVVQNGKLVQVTPPCCYTTDKDTECNEILVPDNDVFYEKGHCIELVRSKFYNSSETACPKNNAVPKDVREQVNAVTAFIDGSLIYGSSKFKAEPLIDDDGTMLIDKNSKYIKGGLMPRSDEDGSCSSFYPGCDQRCFKAGDVRASLTPILGALQTMFLRQHNIIAKAFIARGWDKWQTFNVSRKIIGGMLQVVVYKEYLPLLLGPLAMRRFELSVPTPRYVYRPSLNPSLLNAWATAACRVSHSNIADKLKREGLSLLKCPTLAYDINNMDTFCKPDTDPIRALLVGACQQKMQDLNTVYSLQITRYLFSTPYKPGKDLRAIDYHRARDHGIRPYNEWRRSCGLKPFGSFEEMKRASSKQYGPLIDKLKIAYRNDIDNVDFGVGAILEPLAPGSTFGPTITCLFGHQFHRLKYGDRFWFENPKVPTAFTPQQLSRLQRVTLAGLICATTDVLRIQKNVLLVPGPNNPLVDCATLVREQDLNLASYHY
ncbi:peroxidase [Galendromus occidentalis]|uniref:Peroxidase n=1 Tax=Galendromus occidentalis TaxID=34638 RepID=A0AAJ6VXP4_9ACAR|nr:peroxidase [Galendromus occidentalis]